MNPNPETNFHSGWTGFFGVSRQDITPPAEIFCRCWAAALHDTANSIHRALTLTACTFQATKNDQPFLLIAMDGSWWGSPAEEEMVRHFLLRTLKLPPEKVLINLSHTHSAPPLDLSNSEKTGGHLTKPYLEEIKKKALLAAKAALEKATPCLLDWAEGKCSLAQDRDFLNPKTGEYITGFNPMGSPDQTVLVGRIVKKGNGKIRATIVNYACHLTTLALKNRKISPDYAGAFREKVEKETENAPCIFLLGACGELAPARQYDHRPETADQNGIQLAYSVLEILTGMSPPGLKPVFNEVVKSGAPLGFWEHTTLIPETTMDAKVCFADLPIRQTLPEKHILEKLFAQTTDRVDAERLKRKIKVRNWIGNGDQFSFPIYQWKLGNTLFIGWPAELYSNMQVQLRKFLKKKNPGNQVVVMNMVNGNTGYLLPRSAFEKPGLYQAWQSPFEPGAFERVAEKVMGTIEAFGGKIPV